MKELVNVKQVLLYIDDLENEELLTRAEIDKNHPLYVAASYDWELTLFEMQIK